MHGGWRDGAQALQLAKARFRPAIGVSTQALEFVGGGGG